MTARRMPNGLLRPELADLLEGARVAELLGLDPSQIPHKALTAMGAAVTDQRMADYQGPVYPNDGRDIELSPELEQALDQIEAKMQANPYPRWGTPEYAQAQGQDLEKVQTTPETHEPERPSGSKWTSRVYGPRAGRSRCTWQTEEARPKYPVRDS